MSVMVSQITDDSILYLTVCSGADQRRHQSSTSLAFVRGIHRWPVNSPHKGPVTREMFPFDDANMYWHSLSGFAYKQPLFQVWYTVTNSRCVTGPGKSHHPAVQGPSKSELKRNRITACGFLWIECSNDWKNSKRLKYKKIAKRKCYKKYWVCVCVRVTVYKWLVYKFIDWVNIFGTKYLYLLFIFLSIHIYISRRWLNILWPGDAIWWHGSGSFLIQVIACCLTESSPEPMLTFH